MAYYKIVSRMNGLALDVSRNGTNPGTQVIMWQYHGKDNQQWYEDLATGTIRTKINGFCLDIEGDQNLRIMPYQPGDPNQQWERDSQGYIRNRVNRNKVLDIKEKSKDSGAAVIIWDQNGGENQLWNFERIGDGAPLTAASTQRREFYIVSDFASGKVFDVKGGKANSGDDIILWSKNQGKNQRWYVDQNGYIRSAVNDSAINAEGGHKAETEPFNGGKQQQWVLQGNGIINRANGECLDLYKGKKDDGATIGSWQWNDSPNQHWRIEYA